MVGGIKQILVLISLIIFFTILDSQFINIFYGTNFEIPGNLHLLLFVSLVSLVIAVITITTILLLFTKRNDIKASTSRPIFFRIAYMEWEKCS
jgi:hypothetical protein